MMRTASQRIVKLLAKLEHHLTALEEKFKAQDRRLLAIEGANQEILVKLGHITLALEALHAANLQAVPTNQVADPNNNDQTSNQNVTHSSRLLEQLHKTKASNQSLFHTLQQHHHHQHQQQQQQKHQFSPDQQHQNQTSGCYVQANADHSHQVSASSSISSSPSMSPVDAPSAQHQLRQQLRHHHHQHHNHQHHQQHHNQSQLPLMSSSPHHGDPLQHLHLARSSTPDQNQTSQGSDNNNNRSLHHQQLHLHHQNPLSLISSSHNGSSNTNNCTNSNNNNNGNSNHNINSGRHSSASMSPSLGVHSALSTPTGSPLGHGGPEGGPHNNNNNTNNNNNNLAGLSPAQLAAQVAAAAAANQQAADQQSTVAAMAAASQFLSALARSQVGGQLGDLDHLTQSHLLASTLGAAANASSMSDAVATNLSNLHARNGNGSQCGPASGNNSCLPQQPHNNRQALAGGQPLAGLSSGSPAATAAAVAAQLSMAGSAPGNQSGANQSAVIHSIPHPHSHHALSHPAASLLISNPHYQTVRTKYSTRRYSRRRVGPDEAMADPAIRATVQLKMPVVPKTILIVLKHRLTVQTAITLACAQTGERLRKGAIQKKLEAMFREPGAVDAFLAEWNIAVDG